MKKDDLSKSVFWGTFIPFSLMIVPNALSFFGRNNNLWLNSNKACSILLLLGTVLLTFLKKYKHEFFYLWFGFSIYFAPIFISEMFVRGYSEKIGGDALIHFYGYSWQLNPSFKNFIIPNLFVALNIIIFIVLVTIFKVSLRKIFILLIVWFFTFSYIRIEPYKTLPLGSKNPIFEVMIGVILITILSILLLDIFYKLKKFKYILITFLVYLFLNFIAIHLFEFFRIEKERGLVKTLLSFADNYLMYFIVFSHLPFYLLFFLILYFIRPKLFKMSEI